MNLADVIDSVKMYLHYDTADSAIQARLDVMIPRAVNNARLWAERKHVWALSYTTLWYRVSAASGADLFAGQLTRAALDLTTLPTPQRMKSVVAVDLEHTDGSLSPLMLRSLGAVQRLDIQKKDLQTELAEWPEQEQDGAFSTPFATILGRQLAVKPATDCILRVQGFQWMSDYNSADIIAGETITDFFTEYVPDILIWKAVIDCNYLTQTFVNRQDGNVGIPKDMLTDAWDSAMDWDAYQHQFGINYQLG